MRRNLMHILVGIDAMLLALLAGVWLLSYDSTIRITWLEPDRHTMIWLRGGRAYVVSFPESSSRTVGYFRWTLIDGQDSLLTRYIANTTSRSWRLGFGRLTVAGTGAPPIWVVPCWPVASLLLLLPALWLRSQHRRRRRTRWTCPVCGYDVRASRGRCGECGWVMPYGLSLLVAMRNEREQEQCRSNMAQRVAGQPEERRSWRKLGAQSLRGKIKPGDSGRSGSRNARA